VRDARPSIDASSIHIITGSCYSTSVARVGPHLTRNQKQHDRHLVRDIEALREMLKISQWQRLRRFVGFHTRAGVCADASPACLSLTCAAFSCCRRMRSMVRAWNAKLCTASVEGIRGIPAGVAPRRSVRWLLDAVESRAAEIRAAGEFMAGMRRRA